MSGAAEASSASAPPRALLIRIFVTALVLRWVYVVALYAWFGIDGLKGPDSSAYLVLAEGFAKAAASGQISGWGWLGPDLSLMPLITWWLTLHALVAGDLAAFTFVLSQAPFDAGTCVLVACIAGMFAPRAARFAGYAAAFTPALIVLSGLVYTDTEFVFFAALTLYAALRWLAAPSRRWAMILGLGLGLAAMVRIVIAPFAPPLLILLALGALIRRRRIADASHLVSAGLILVLFIAPVVARNVAVYGAWSLTPQGGNHLAFWVLPLVREAHDGTPREKSKAEIEAKLTARYGNDKGDNPFVVSARNRAFAEEELRALGIAAVARAWANGAAINLGAPSVVHVPPVSSLPRTGFYDTPGANFTAKLLNFLFGGNPLYSWLLIIGIAGVAAFRIVQLVGLVALLRRGANWAGLLVLAGWCAFVLGINGPVASPKYRLPLEPVLAVLSGIGLAAFSNRRRKSGSSAKAA